MEKIKEPVKEITKQMTNLGIPLKNMRKESIVDNKIGINNITKDAVVVISSITNNEPYKMQNIKPSTSSLYRQISPRNIIYGQSKKIENDRLKFINIPETRGETIEILTGIVQTNNSPKVYKFDKDDYIFSFVRNPYTRLYSWYISLRKEIDENNIKIKYDKHRELALLYSFKEWVITMIDNKETYDEPLFGPLGTQYEMLFDKNDNRLVHDIYYFEDFSKEVSKFLRKIKRTEMVLKLVEMNRNIKNPNPKDAYDNELLIVVYEYFKKDFITLSYKPFVI